MNTLKKIIRRASRWAWADELAEMDASRHVMLDTLNQTKEILRAAAGRQRVCMATLEAIGRLPMSHVVKAKMMATKTLEMLNREEGK